VVEPSKVHEKKKKKKIPGEQFFATFPPGKKNQIFTSTKDFLFFEIWSKLH